MSIDDTVALLNALGVLIDAVAYLIWVLRNPP
jgi:hypothetical protein